MSYEEKIEQLVGVFDNISVRNTDSQIVFEAYTDVSDFDFSGIQYLSSSSETTIKKYKTNLDLENEKFYIVTEYIQDNVLVYSEMLETTPYYDEYADDYYIEMPDGTNVSLEESLSQENIDNCSVTLATLGIALSAKEVAAILATVVVVAAPIVVEVVDVIVTKVVTWARSFWSWFKSLWTKKQPQWLKLRLK